MKRWTQATRGMHFLWLPIPASSAVPFFVAMLHMAWWTFLTAFLVVIFQVVMRAKGRTVLWMVRRAKTRLAGGVIQARSIWYQRRMRRRDGFDQIDLDEVQKM